MNSRERTLAILLIGLITLGGGALLGYFFVYSPLQDKYAEAEKLQNEANDFDDKVLGVRAAKARIEAAKRQSLPPDINLAKAQYKLLLEKLLRAAGITDYKIPDMRVLDSRAPITPELVIRNPNAPAAGTPAPANPTTGAAPATPQSQKKPAYTRLEFKVDVKKADIWQIAEFLKAFYDVDLLHQITFINITRENKVTESRAGLDLHLTIEAIILDQATPRKDLLPPNSPPSGVLATKQRDYSYLAWKDIFYGILPSVSPPPFTLARIDSVTLERDEKPAEVKVKLSGDGSTGAKVVAKATGSLLPAGELKFDPKTGTITIPGAGNEETPDDASSTISVVATSTEGVTTERSFKVSIAKKPAEKPPEKPKIDISSAIRLVILSGTSDGATKAVIYDAANPFKFDITTNGKKVEVTRFWQATGKNWRKDRDYDQPDGVLAFADEFSATKRTFKVVAFEDDAVILSESGRADVKVEPPKKSFRPGGGSSTKQGPAEPLAVVAGNMATAIPAPTLYRWSLGKSLQELTKLSPTEAKTLLKRVAADGPVLNTAVADGK